VSVIYTPGGVQTNTINESYPSVEYRTWTAAFLKRSHSWKSVINITTKSASLRQHFKHASVCETKDDSVYVNRLLCVSGCACACVWACSVASLLLQQGGDVDVPANGLSVEATCEQVARLVLFVPRRTAHHSPVTLHTHTHTHTLYSCW